jgi:hypothetical protein
LSDAIESALDSVPLADPQETRDEFARRSMCSPVLGSRGRRARGSKEVE